MQINRLYENTDKTETVKTTECLQKIYKITFFGKYGMSHSYLYSFLIYVGNNILYSIFVTDVLLQKLLAVNKFITIFS